MVRAAGSRPLTAGEPLLAYPHHPGPLPQQLLSLACYSRYGPVTVEHRHRPCFALHRLELANTILRHRRRAGICRFLAQETVLRPPGHNCIQQDALLQSDHVVAREKLRMAAMEMSM